MPETLERLQRLPAALGIGAPPPPDCHLSIEGAGLASRQVPLLGGCYRIGRDSAAEVVVDHAVVSRRHALLERHGSHWLLRDNDSTNGLWWRGKRVRALVLRDG
ncbi:MAG: FHA domain-containing protein, partial [Cyanobium sp.]